MEIEGKRLQTDKKASIMVSEGLRVRLETTIDDKTWQSEVEEVGPYIINLGTFGLNRQYSQVRFVIEEIL